MTSDNEPVFTEAAQRFHQQKEQRHWQQEGDMQLREMKDISYVSLQEGFKRSETQDIREGWRSKVIE